MTDDMALVREFAANASEAAFEMLVARHINVVYSTALRRVSDAHLAEEITQAVFIILAHKAGSLGSKTILSGWLYRTARFAAADSLKIQRRRQRREQESYMQSILNESQSSEVWHEIAPVLEAAMDSLNERDRNAVILRFLDGKNMDEVGAVLGVGADAARMRVSRALEKLHRYFSKRGVSSTTTIIAGAISTNSVQTAPAALIKATTAAALAKGASASSSTLTLIKGALKLMAWTNAKTAIVAGVGLLLAAGTTTIVLKQLTPQITDEMWMADWNGIRKLPPVLVLRSSKFLDKQSGMMADGKYVYRNQPFGQVFNIAYPGIGGPRCVQKFQIPTAGYNFEKHAMPKLTNGLDLMLTLTNHPIEALQQEIAKQFGFVAHHEIIETNVLLLKVAKSDAPGLKPGKGHGAPMNVGGLFNPTNEPYFRFLRSYLSAALRFHNAARFPGTRRKPRDLDMLQK